MLCKRKIDDDSIHDVAHSVIKNKQVKVVDLSNNMITSEGLVYFLEKVSFHSKLEKIILNGNMLDDTVFKKIEEVSKHLKNIKCFNLEDNPCLKNISKLKRCKNSLTRLGIKIEH